MVSFHHSFSEKRPCAPPNSSQQAAAGNPTQTDRRCLTCLTDGRNLCPAGSSGRSDTLNRGLVVLHFFVVTSSTKSKLSLKFLGIMEQSWKSKHPKLNTLRKAEKALHDLPYLQFSRCVLCLSNSTGKCNHDVAVLSPQAPYRKGSRHQANKT